MMWNDQFWLFVWSLFVYFNSLGIKYSLAEDKPVNIPVLKEATKKFDDCIGNHQIPYGETCSHEDKKAFEDKWENDNNKESNLAYHEGLAKLTCFGGNTKNCQPNANKCPLCDDPCKMIQTPVTDCGKDFNNWDMKQKQAHSFKESTKELDKCLSNYFVDEHEHCETAHDDFIKSEFERRTIVCDGYVLECFSKIPIDLHQLYAKRQCRKPFYCDKDQICKQFSGDQEPVPVVVVPDDGCKSKLADVVKKHEIAAAAPGSSPPEGSGSKNNSTSSHLHFEFLLIVPVFFITAATDLNSLLS